MAKLTISDAARAAGVARSTIQRAVRSGRLSADPDHLIDTAELLRAGFTLHEAPQQQSGAVRQVAAVRSGSNAGVQQDAPAAFVQELALLRQEHEALHRERDLLHRQLDAAMEREQTAQEREALLLHMLQEAQQQSQRLLDMPRGPAGGGMTPVRSVQRSATVPETWQRIMGYMRDHHGPTRPGEVQKGLEMVSTPRYVMKRMVEKGLLRRGEPGVYVVHGIISGGA